MMVTRTLPLYALRSTVMVWVLVGTAASCVGSTGGVIRFLNVPLEDAKAQIKQLGLEVGKVDSYYSDEYAEGRVYLDNLIAFPHTGVALGALLTDLILRVIRTVDSPLHLQLEIAQNTLVLVQLIQGMSSLIRPLMA